MATILDKAELKSSLYPATNLKMIPNHLEGMASPCLSSHSPFILSSPMKTILFLSSLPLPITTGGTLVPHLIVYPLDSRPQTHFPWRGNLKHWIGFNKIENGANQNIRTQVPFCLLNVKLKIARRYFEETEVGKLHVFYFPNLCVQ